MKMKMDTFYFKLVRLQSVFLGLTVVDLVKDPRVLGGLTTSTTLSFYLEGAGCQPEDRLTYVKRRRAFTLIEIIVALVLGTLLLATLMGVLRRSFSEIGSATRDDPSVARFGLLVEQLRRDLTNARKMYVGNNRFELVGFIHRDPSTLIATLRPARVLYEIRQNGIQSLLVRVQTDDTRGMRSADPFTELVYLGAMNVLVSSNDVRAFSEADRIGLSSVNLSSLLNRRDAVPSSVQIVILDQRGRTILDQTFWRERDAS